MDYEGVDVKYSAGQPYVGAIVRMYPGPGGNRGAFVAWDPVAGKKKWEIKENLAAYGGALTTAGGIVFYGTMEGWLKAVDQRTGRELWRFKCPSGIIGDPMTYSGPDGKQYVAVLSGIGGWAGIGVALGMGAEDPTAGRSAPSARSAIISTCRTPAARCSSSSCRDQLRSGVLAEGTMREHGLMLPHVIF